MTAVISNFEPAHYAAARALWAATPGVGLSRADERVPIEQFLARNPGLSFVATDAGRLVGTVLCGHDGRRGLIHHLVAAGSHRRQGLGRALLRAGLRGLAAQGIDKCHLLVFRDNPEGLAFWRAVAATERTELALYSLDTFSAA
jgi:ribosomal protein S18 acetylase RimI-like enzyme